eukprot:358232-Chlamydomonas_euryale.AAC.7
MSLLGGWRRRHPDAVHAGGDAIRIKFQAMPQSLTLMCTGFIEIWCVGVDHTGCAAHGMWTDGLMDQWTARPPFVDGDGGRDRDNPHSSQEPLHRPAIAPTVTPPFLPRAIALQSFDILSVAVTSPPPQDRGPLPCLPNRCRTQPSASAVHTTAPFPCVVCQMDAWRRLLLMPFGLTADSGHYDWVIVVATASTALMTLVRNVWEGGARRGWRAGGNASAACAALMPLGIGGGGASFGSTVCTVLMTLAPHWDCGTERKGCVEISNQMEQPFPLLPCRDIVATYEREINR